MKRILNIADVELEPRPPAFAAHGDAAQRFYARMGRVSMQLGAQKLGYNITAVPPGKRAFPLHNHRVNEEMFFILQGEGEIRVGAERHPIRQGDIIACPPGGPESAHQIINTGSVEMRYLAVSSKLTPEICEYPDSNKYGILGEFEPDAEGKPQMIRIVMRQGDTTDYWEGE
ncbi:MAG TPA: cupin domain-containing protein [Dyella sp.]|uniref:cupin domain-containing protein n=1 Tax=Dyella sp. TaxID=1869338 RepID=UPI002CF15BD4|nr:cupin domain-containing protein [Dyella sp.]HUB91254.1 cupin domain-containing protein [Dyella sp.]